MHLRHLAVGDDRLQTAAIVGGDCEGDASANPIDSHKAREAGILVRKILFQSIH
jgi:hypothetical protein